MTPVVDGQQRLFQIDYDDQGYVYLAYGAFGWGIVKDDGGNGGTLMQALPFADNKCGTPPKQCYNDLTSGKPGQIVAFKSAAGRYYALLAGGKIFDTTDRSNPRFVRSGPFFQAAVKDSTATRLALLNATGGIDIWKTDDFIAGGVPLASFSTGNGSTYSLITTDGTNFYGDAINNSTVTIGAIRYDGFTYTQTLYPTSVGISRQPSFASGFQYGAGFICISGIGSDGHWDMALVKMDNAAPSVVDLHNYIEKYYSATPDANHVTPPNINLDDAVVYKQGSHYYLIVDAGGLGDVYEIQGADSINVMYDGCQQSQCGSNPFYGDTLLFHAESSTSSPVQLLWDFGNPGASDNNPPGPNFSGATIKHQYSNMTQTSFTAAHTVTATSAVNSQIASSVTVNLKRPSAAFKIAGAPTLLFKQPDASSAAPIVAGDKFVDASDGELLGHWNAWMV